jgi:hypothetical protein
METTIESKNVNEQIHNSEKISVIFERKMKTVIKTIMTIITICYLLVVIPMMAYGVNEIQMHITGFMAMTLVIPVMTFFAGMWLVWQVKFTK